MNIIDVILEYKPGLEHQLAYGALVAREVGQVVHLNVVDHKVLGSVAEFTVKTEEITRLSLGNLGADDDVPGQNSSVLNEGIVGDFHLFRSCRGHCSYGTIHMEGHPLVLF